MASKEEGSEPLQCKTCVLKVSIHCEGCKKKVRRILQNVDGVYAIEIDSQQNKVTVTGNVEAETLIRKLLKSGKHADLWPVERKKPNNPNPNPNPNPNSNSKEKGKEKQQDASKSNEPNEKKTEKPPEKSAPATKPETDTKPTGTAAPAEKVAPAAKPTETDTKSAAVGTEVSGSSTNKEASKPDPNPQKAPASSEPETKPADTVTKGSGSGSAKKKGKKEAEAAGNEEFVMNSGGAPPAYQVPEVYPQPVYAASYNMAHPTTSYSYYAPMPPPMPQSYMYSGHPPLPPPPEYYPRYQHYQPENYYGPPPENYYGPMEPPASSSSQSQGSYDFFSDENANSCNVM